MQDIDTLHECLDAIGYNGKLLKKDLLENLITSGPKSDDFRELVCWISNEINILSKTEEKVNSNTEFSEFMLEVSALLKELGCPYEQLIGGNLTDRFQTKESRFLLFDFLTTNLMTTKMCIDKEPEDTSHVIEKIESRTAKALESITKDLGLGKPPENIGAKDLFEKINKKLILTLDKIDKNAMGEPLFNSSKQLTEAQWKELERMNQELEKEYDLRKEMLLTRLDVTVQSFLWCDKMKKKQDEIMKIYQEKLKEIDALDNCLETGSLAGLIAARTNRTVIEKVSNARVRQNTFGSGKVQRHIIGKVPDRGGRAFEHEIPPPEMPSWQQNRSTGPQGGGGGGGGGGRGGRGGFQGNRGGGGNFNQDNRGGGGNYNQDSRGGGGNYNQDTRGGGNFNKGGGGGYNQGSGGGQGYNQGGGGGGYSQGGGGGYNRGGGGGNYNQNSGGGSYNQGSNFNQASGNSGYNQGASNGSYNQTAGREGNYNQGDYSQSSNNQQGYDNSNRSNYTQGQSRIQGRGGNFGNDRYNSGDATNRRSDQGGFSRGRSNYNRGGGNRY